MIPIKPLFTLPIKLYNQLHAASNESDTLLKKIAKAGYNGTAPPLAATLAALASLGGILLATSWNVLSFPFVTLKNKIQNHTPSTHTIAHKPSPKNTLKELQNLYPIQWSPNTPTTAPDLQNEAARYGTNTFLTEFLKGTKKIPGSNISWQNLIDVMKDRKGYHLLTTAPSLIAVLLPTRKGLSQDTPKLSRQMVYQIQTDSKMASKYLHGALTVLECLGMQLNERGQFCQTKDFASLAQKIQSDPDEHQQWLTEVVISLAECGFGTLSQRALDFLYENKEAYGLKRLRHTLFSINSLKKFFATTRTPSTEPSWKTPAGKIYLENYFASDGQDIDAQASPLWFTPPTTKMQKLSADPAFSSQTPLLQWDPKSKKWTMPHLDEGS